MTTAQPIESPTSDPAAMPRPAAQLVRDAQMVIVTYKADRDALRDALPPGLEPHPDGRAVLTMWDVNDPGQTSGFGGFGPVSVTYVAVEVAGHDAATADGSMLTPGRYFAAHWVSSEDGGAYAQYAHDAAGVRSYPGDTVLSVSGNEATWTLTLDGRPTIAVTAEVGDEPLMSVGGHLNYFADRPRPRGTGMEIANIHVPTSGVVYGISIKDVSFALPQGAPASALAPLQPLEIDSVLYGKLTWSPFGVRNVLPGS